MTAPRGEGPARSPGASGGARGAVVIGLAVILGIVGLQILDDSGDGSSDASVTTVPGSTSGAPTTTTPTVREPKDVKVKVYNASGVQGKAQTLSDMLRTQNYNVLEPANLAERPGNAVQCVSGFDREAAALAASVPGGAAVEAFPSSPPEGATDADCLVIIGTA